MAATSPLGTACEWWVLDDRTRNGHGATLDRLLALAIWEDEAQRGIHPPQRIDKGLC